VIEPEAMTLHIYDGVVERLEKKTLRASFGLLSSGLNYVGRACWGKKRNFHGYISEFRVWNRARSPREIAATRYMQLLGDEDGLVGYWPFDQESEGVAKDLSGKGNHARIAIGGRIVNVLGPSVKLRTQLLFERGSLAFDDADWQKAVGFLIQVRPESSNYLPSQRMIWEAKVEVRKGLVREKLKHARQVYVRPAVLNVRSGPGTEHEKTARLERSAKIHVIGKAGEWLNVFLPDETEGWVLDALTGSARRKGIGVSLNKINHKLSESFLLEEGSRVDGYKRQNATTAGATLEVVGPDHNLVEASFSFYLTFDNFDLLIENSGLMLQFLKNVDPTWWGARGWIDRALSEIEYGRNTQDTTRGIVHIELRYLKALGILMATVKHK
jgi:hypothetical protein